MTDEMKSEVNNEVNNEVNDKKTYILPGSTSRDYIRRLQSSVAIANYIGLYGVVFQDAKDITLTDVDGNTFLDFFSGASVVILGYNQESLVDIFVEATKKIHHTCSTYSPTIPPIFLSEALIRTHPGNYEKKVMLGVSGSDSIDGAIKAAIAYTKKKKIVCFSNSYHGSTGYSFNATDLVNSALVNPFSFPASSSFIHLPYPSTEEIAVAVLDEIQALSEEGELAGVLIEPIQGDSGVFFPAERFFQRLQTICEDNNVVTIVDEIQSGMGRTGKFWSFENYGFIPDLIVCGKGLSNGFAPLSAVIGKKEIIDSLKKAQHVFTFTGHPATCAVAIKVIEKVQEQLLEIREKGSFLRERLEGLALEFPNITCNVRGKGLMVGMELRDSEKKPLAGIVGKRCAEHGIYVGFYGKNNEVLRIQPPYIVTREQIGGFISVLREVLLEVTTGKIPEETYVSYKKYSLGLGTDN